jgi:hypothetical protein
MASDPIKGRANGRSCWRLPRRYPGLPDSVHGIKVLPPAEPDGCKEDLRLVAADDLKQPVDGRENFPGLTHDVLRQVLCSLSGQVGAAVMNHCLAEPLPRVESLDVHGVRATSVVMPALEEGRLPSMLLKMHAHVYKNYLAIEIQANFCPEELKIFMIAIILSF